MAPGMSLNQKRRWGLTRYLPLCNLLSRDSLEPSELVLDVLRALQLANCMCK